MRYEGLDELIRDAMQEERAEARELLDGMERTVTVHLASHPAPRSWWRRWGEMLLGPRPAARFAVAGAMTAALLIGFAAGRVWLPSGVPMLETGGTLFAVAAPRAEFVAVMGDFSAWQPIPLEDREGSGMWTAALELPPGRYEYAFLVDGRWVGQDPVADEYVRSFGEFASVRYVKGDT